MKLPKFTRFCTVFLAMAPLAWAQTEAPSVSGRLHLKINDGKGNIREMDLPEKGPMVLDLTPFKHLMTSAEDIERLAESAKQSMDVWTADLTRRLEKMSGGKTAWMGVATQPVPEATASQLPVLKGAGLIIRDVSPGSPAATAGLKTDDILWRINDQTLFSAEQLQKLIATFEPGAAVSVVFFREGAEQKATCTLGAVAKNQVGEMLANALLGPDAAGKMQEFVGPGAEILLSAIAANPELLKNMPSLNQVLKVGPDGKWKLEEGNAKLLMDQVRQQLADPSAGMSKAMEGMAKALIENKEAGAMLQSALQQLEKMEQTNPETHKKLMEMMQAAMQGLQNAAEKK